VFDIHSLLQIRDIAKDCRGEAGWSLRHIVLKESRFRTITAVNYLDNPVSNCETDASCPNKLWR